MHRNYRNKFEAELPKVDTPIWACTQEDCKGWMRDNFAFDSEPTCSLCHSPMVKSTRMLPALSNSSQPAGNGA